LENFNINLNIIIVLIKKLKFFKKNEELKRFQNILEIVFEKKRSKRSSVAPISMVRPLNKSSNQSKQTTLMCFFIFFTNEFIYNHDLLLNFT